MKNYNYYKEQLEKIKPNDLGSAAQIQLNKNGIRTHWLSLNDESATELFLWLKENYNIKDEQGLYL